VQQCSRTSARDGKRRFAFSRVKIDQICQPLVSKRINTRAQATPPPAFAGLNPHGLLQTGRRRLAGRTIERVAKVIGTEGSSVGRTPH